MPITQRGGTAGAYQLASEQGFEEMYRDYFPRIYNYVFYRVLSREDTEDIVSEVFLKAAKNARTYDPEKAGMGTWLYRIAENTLTDHFRRKRFRILSFGEAPEPMVDFERQLAGISSEKRRMVFRELARLQEKERRIVYYKFFEGYSNREIAAALDMNESTVGTALSRSLKKLRTEELAELWFE